MRAEERRYAAVGSHGAHTGEGAVEARGGTLQAGGGEGHAEDRVHGGSVAALLQEAAGAT